jgi:hypothetical protein
LGGEPCCYSDDERHADYIDQPGGFSYDFACTNDDYLANTNLDDFAKSNRLSGTK